LKVDIGPERTAIVDTAQASPRQLEKNELESVSMNTSAVVLPRGLPGGRFAVCTSWFPARASGDQRSIPDEFHLMEVMSRVADGSRVVYAASRRSDGKLVTLKMSKELVGPEDRSETARKEFDTLRGLEHPNIARALDFFSYPLGVVLTLEYFEGQSLELAVQSSESGRFAEEVAKRFFAPLMKALDHIHSRGMCHCNINSHSVLVDGHIKDLRLVDFSLARGVSDKIQAHEIMYHDYAAPEVVLGDFSHASTAADVWSASLCLYTSLYGKLLAGPTPSEVLCEGGDSIGSVSAPCADVLRQCLSVEPAARPSAGDVLASHWLVAIRSVTCRHSGP